MEPAFDTLLLNTVTFHSTLRLLIRIASYPSLLLIQDQPKCPSRSMIPTWKCSMEAIGERIPTRQEVGTEGHTTSLVMIGMISPSHSKGPGSRCMVRNVQRKLITSIVTEDRD